MWDPRNTGLLDTRVRGRTDASMTATAERYERFAHAEAANESATYAALALGVAGDPELLGKLDALPPIKRQPNLLFGAVRYLGGPTDVTEHFIAWARDHWNEVSATMMSRLTQTNEPGRQATLLLLLARIDGPVALLEVGAAAGLCLYPDQWSYDFSGVRVGDPALPALPCIVEGDVPTPDSLPDVVWRAGLDLNPLDVTREDDMRWLECLIWPEHEHRRRRLATAIEIARQDAPYLVPGDLGSTLRGLAADAPRDATLVVFHSAVLAYVPPEQRDAFVETVRELPGHWLSNEAKNVLPSVVPPPPPKPHAAAFLMAWDGTPVAWAGPHGQSLTWL